VEEAVEQAVQELGVAKEKLDIRLLQEPSKGFLGLRSRPAIIEAVLKEDADVRIEEASAEDETLKEEPVLTEGSVKDHALGGDNVKRENVGIAHDVIAQATIEKAVRFLEDVLPKMGLSEIQIDVKQGDERHILLVLSGKEIGLAIGRRGQTLDALQYLTNVVANRGQKEYVSFIVDAENYRERRRKTLEQLADRLAKEVIRTREKIALEPMSAAERKIIHTHLQHYAGVKTISEGEEPNRRVVLWPK
jgi:spoIIIJ-associated protein